MVSIARAAAGSGRVAPTLVDATRFKVICSFRTASETAKSSPEVNSVDHHGTWKEFVSLTRIILRLDRSISTYLSFESNS